MKQDRWGSRIGAGFNPVPPRMLNVILFKITISQKKGIL